MGAAAGGGFGGGGGGFGGGTGTGGAAGTTYSGGTPATGLSAPPSSGGTPATGLSAPPSAYGQIGTFVNSLLANLGTAYGAPQPAAYTPPPPSTAQDYFTPAGGGFLGRGTQPVGRGSFDPTFYSQEYGSLLKGDYANSPYKHYTEVGLEKGLLPYETATAPPSTQAKYRPSYVGWQDPSFVQQGYQSMLGRAPSAYEQQYWDAEMGRGLTGQGLVAAGLASPELQRRQEFSRAYTEAFRPGYQEFGPSGQYYQPIYQSGYTNYSRSPGFYQPSYGTSMMAPSQMGYGFGSFNPFAYAEGGTIAEDEGIAALRNE